MTEINNLSRFSVDLDLLLRTVEFVLKEEGCKGNISIAIIEKEEMHALNKQCRGKDSATDVLSFSYLDGEDLGEVIICPEEAKMGFYRVLVHGVLHVLGYEHSPEMEEKQERYLSLLDSKIFNKIKE